jgi:lysophospholipase L1-like esterase
MMHGVEAERPVIRALGGVLLMVLAIAMTLLLLEAALRVLGMLDPIIYRSDPVFGYEPRPRQSATRLGIPIYINDIGLRDDENASALLRSKRRVLVIGNSVTYGGSRIHQHDLLTEVLERALRDGGGDIKVLNAGVNGYSVSQMVARARTLLAPTKPTALVLFAIRSDFLRPPVQYIREGNVAYPMHRPASALVDFLKLSLNHLNSRHRFLPNGIAGRIMPTPTYSPPYDTTHIIDTHFAAFDNFLSTSWEASGRARDDIVVFLSPTRADLLENRLDPNADLVRRFAALHIRAYDLQKDYYQATIAGGHKTEDYYFDAVHYLEPGHALAAQRVAAYLLGTSAHAPSGR